MSLQHMVFGLIPCNPTGVATGMRPESLQELLDETRPDLIPIFLNALPAVMAEPIDISNAVLFLVSGESRFVTGLEFKSTPASPCGDCRRPQAESQTMRAIDTERSGRGRRLFAEVMTFDPPEDTSPAAVAGLLDFVFGEIWSRPVLSRRDRLSSRWRAWSPRTPNNAA